MRTARNEYRVQCQRPGMFTVWRTTDLTILGAWDTWTDAMRHANELAEKEQTPALPAPDDCPPDIHQPGWQLDEYGDKFAGVLAGRVWVTDRYGWGRSYDPDNIRTAAHKLLAAAEEAKRGRL